MWGGSDESESVAAIHAALERGIKLIDTAPVYGFGRSEEIVGKAWRNAACARARSSPPRRPGMAGRQGLPQCEPYPDHAASSRTRCAACAPTTSISTRFTGPIRWFRSRKRPRHGHALQAGQDPRHRCEQFLGRANGTIPPRRAAPRTAIALQPVRARHRGEILPYCRKNNISPLGYGALCRGLLSGQDAAGHDVRRRRLCAGTDPNFSSPASTQYLAAVREFDSRRAATAGRIIHLAVRWILDQGITCGAVGCAPAPNSCAGRRSRRLVARC